MVLIAGLDPSYNLTPPNLPPEFTSTPAPIWTESVGGTYDFRTITTDPEGDTLTFTLNAGSASLPAGVSLASNGVMTATSSVVAGTTPGIIVDVDDGTNPPVASASFTISIETAGQDIEFQWDFQDQALGDARDTAQPPFFIEEQPTPLPDNGTYMEIKDTSPLVTGTEKHYLNIAINKDNGSGHRRVEYAATYTQADPNRQSIVRLTSDAVAGGPANDQWTATEEQWYGMLVRVDQVVNEGPGGILMQFHSVGLVPSAIPGNPLWYLSGNSAGFRIKTERTDYYDNTLAAQSWDIPEMRWPACQGEVHAIIFHVFWDSRELADGGQGFMNVYIDDNVTPLVADTGRNVTHMYSEISSVYKGPYLKFGMYATGVRTGTYEQSFDNFVVMGKNGTRQGMVDALDWANRVV